jgi:phospholipase C
VVNAVNKSPYAASTLILLTYDEGGGFFDHVTPPANAAADGKPYGTRVPLVAIGPFAKKNAVSHVVMEHSSIVKFIEWNWLGGTTGQLMGRDAAVNNLGDLLDAAKTGTAVPTS